MVDKTPLSDTPKTEPEDVKTINLYEAQQKLYPRLAKGIFNNIRILFVIITQIVYFGLPWLQLNNRQAVWFDLADRKFYLFNLVIWPQDFFYLAALLICCAFGLFTWTTLAGRLWCGYACPQTVYTEIMSWIETWIEGGRNKRIKLDQQPAGFRKFTIKFLKHGLMLIFALWTGITLVGYFIPIKTLITNLVHFHFVSWEAFWIAFYAGFTYLFAGILREQVCKYMCPYARFQSVMFDADTLIVSYDTVRGEPRGARKKGINPHTENKGDCIDCSICVQVCPTGIDIRNGLQYECIGCAACVDACNEIMDKMSYPRGLIRFTTENALNNVYPNKQIIHRLKRPRAILYGLILFMMLGATFASLELRVPFQLDVLRDRSVLVRENEDGWLENGYRLEILNMTERKRSFHISVEGLPELKFSSADNQQISVNPGSVSSINVTVQADPEYATPGSHKIHFRLTAEDDPSLSVDEQSSFIGE